MAGATAGAAELGQVLQSYGRCCRALAGAAELWQVLQNCGRYCSYGSQAGGLLYKEVRCYIDAAKSLKQSYRIIINLTMIIRGCETYTFLSQKN